MPGRGKKDPAKSQTVGTRSEPKSLRIAEAGVSTSRDFRNLMSAIMSDVIAGRLTPNMTNAACNAGGKLLKMVDLEYKYGTDPERKHGTITVAFDAPVPEQLPAAAAG